jgi:hypothetical protein
VQLAHYDVHAVCACRDQCTMRSTITNHGLVCLDAWACKCARAYLVCKAALYAGARYADLEQYDETEMPGLPPEHLLRWTA